MTETKDSIYTDVLMQAYSSRQGNFVHLSYQMFFPREIEEVIG